MTVTNEQIEQAINSYREEIGVSKSARATLETEIGMVRATVEDGWLKLEAANMRISEIYNDLQTQIALREAIFDEIREARKTISTLDEAVSKLMEPGK